MKWEGKKHNYAPFAHQNAKTKKQWVMEQQEHVWDAVEYLQMTHDWMKHMPVQQEQKQKNAETAKRKESKKAQRPESSSLESEQMNTWMNQQDIRQRQRTLLFPFLFTFSSSQKRSNKQKQRFAWAKKQRTSWSSSHWWDTLRQLFSHSKFTKLARNFLHVSSVDCPEFAIASRCSVRCIAFSALFLLCCLFPALCLQWLVGSNGWFCFRLEFALQQDFKDWVFAICNQSHIIESLLERNSLHRRIAVPFRAYWAQSLLESGLFHRITMLSLFMSLCLL